MAVQSNDGTGIFSVFFDAGASTTLFASQGGGVSAAFGLVGGQGAYAVCQNGSALSAADVKMCCKVLRLASETGNPVVTFYNSKGAKLEEGLDGLKAASRLAAASARLSGVVPQISVVTGVCGASAAMAAASADLCILCKDAQLFLTAPFLSAAAGDTLDGAGSAEAAVAAGIAAMVCDNEEVAAREAAKLLMLLPANNLSAPAGFEYTPPMGVLNMGQYSAQSAVEAVADDGSAAELFAGFGKGASVYLGTVSGAVCGFVATAGEQDSIDKEASAKIARFVRFCDAFSMPVITLLNSAGFMASSSEDVAGNLREAARLASTYADATTAKLAVVTGKAVGTLYSALGHADLTIAMQGSVVAPVEPSAAASVLYKESIDNSGNPIDAETAKYAKEYVAEVAGADAAAKAGVASFVADAGSLRATVTAALDILSTKRTQRLPKKHGNMPL